MPLYGGLSTQAGAFEPLSGPQAAALKSAHGVLETHQRLKLPYMGNLGWLLVHGVADAPLVGPRMYPGITPSDPLSAQLSRNDPWSDPAAALGG